MFKKKETEPAIKAEVKEAPIGDVKQEVVKDISTAILAKAQLDLELLDMQTQTYLMVREIYAWLKEQPKEE